MRKPVFCEKSDLQFVGRSISMTFPEIKPIYCIQGRWPAVNIALLIAPSKNMPHKKISLSCFRKKEKNTQRLTHLGNDEKIFSVFTLSNDRFVIIELDWFEGVRYGQTFPLVQVFCKRTQSSGIPKQTARPNRGNAVRDKARRYKNLRSECVLPVAADF